MTSRTGRQVKARRAKELCGWLGCPEKSGDEFHCPRHKLAHAKKMRDWRASKKEAAGDRAAGT